MSSYYCLKCNRALSDPTSIKHGYGPKCWSKIQRHLDADVVPDPVTITDQELARTSRVELRYRLLKYSRIRTCHCGTPLADAEFMTCDHGTGGLPLKGYAVPQWVWFECPKCRYQYAWWKLGPPPLEDLAPPQVVKA